MSKNRNNRYKPVKAPQYAVPQPTFKERASVWYDRNWGWIWIAALVAVVYCLI